MKIISSINFNINFFKQSFTSSLDDQTKRILMIAAIAFTCLVACLLIVKVCFQAKLINGTGNRTLPDGTIKRGTLINGNWTVQDVREYYLMV